MKTPGDASEETDLSQDEIQNVETRINTGLEDFTKTLERKEFTVRSENATYNNGGIGIVATRDSEMGRRYMVRITYLKPNPNSPQYQEHMRQLASGELEPHLSMTIERKRLTRSNPPGFQDYRTVATFHNRDFFEGKDYSPLSQIKTFIESDSFDQSTVI